MALAKEHPKEFCQPSSRTLLSRKFSSSSAPVERFRSICNIAHRAKQDWHSFTRICLLNSLPERSEKNASFIFLRRSRYSGTGRIKWPPAVCSNMFLFTIELLLLIPLILTSLQRECYNFFWFLWTLHVCLGFLTSKGQASFEEKRKKRTSTTSFNDACPVLPCSHPILKAHRTNIQRTVRNKKKTMKISGQRLCAFLVTHHASQCFNADASLSYCSIPPKPLPWGRRHLLRLHQGSDRDRDWFEFRVREGVRSRELID